jgi:hypothetical protein
VAERLELLARDLVVRTEAENGFEVTGGRIARTTVRQNDP